MVSQDNPLSSASRLYNNAFDSKRPVASVANNNRNYGEKQEFYYRSGMESKNNPFAD